VGLLETCWHPNPFVDGGPERVRVTAEPNPFV